MCLTVYLFLIQKHRRKLEPPNFDHRCMFARREDRSLSTKPTPTKMLNQKEQKCWGNIRKKNSTFNNEFLLHMCRCYSQKHYPTNNCTKKKTIILISARLLKNLVRLDRKASSLYTHENRLVILTLKKNIKKLVEEIIQDFNSYSQKSKSEKVMFKV